MTSDYFPSHRFPELVVRSELTVTEGERRISVSPQDFCRRVDILYDVLSRHAPRRVLIVGAGTIDLFTAVVGAFQLDTELVLAPNLESVSFETAPTLFLTTSDAAPDYDVLGDYDVLYVDQIPTAGWCATAPWRLRARINVDHDGRRIWIEPADLRLGGVACEAAEPPASWWTRTGVEGLLSSIAASPAALTAASCLRVRTR